MEKNSKHTKFTEEELKAAKEDLMTEEGFISDPRYKVCNQEAKWGAGLGAFNLVLWLAFGYGLGSGPVSEYTYVFGLPLWFFMSCIITPIIIIFFTFRYTNKMADMSLEAMTEEEAIEFQAEQRRTK